MAPFKRSKISFTLMVTKQSIRKVKAYRKGPTNNSWYCSVHGSTKQPILCGINEKRNSWFIHFGRVDLYVCYRTADIVISQNTNHHSLKNNINHRMFFNIFFYSVPTQLFLLWNQSCSVCKITFLFLTNGLLEISEILRKDHEDHS